MTFSYITQYVSIQIPPQSLVAQVWIKECLEIYNSYFDRHNVDMIVLPAGTGPTPNCFGPVFGADVDPAESGGASGCKDVFWPHFLWFGKELHVPKVLVPTGKVWPNISTNSDMFYFGTEKASSLHITLIWLVFQDYCKVFKVFSCNFAGVYKKTKFVFKFQTLS